MKIGDEIRITSPDFITHQVGDVGIIKALYWSDEDTSMFGVELYDRQGAGDNDELWAYADYELEVIE